MLVNSVEAKKTTVLPLLIQLRALVVPLAGRPKPAAPNVNLVKQECLVMLLVKTVKIAMLANTVQVSMRMVRVLLQLRVLVVQLDIAKVREDKLRAFHAFPVHSMILPERMRANFANRILFQAIEIEPCPVTNASPERHRSKEVSNATEPHAKRVPL